MYVCGYVNVDDKIYMCVCVCVCVFVFFDVSNSSCMTLYTFLVTYFLPCMLHVRDSYLDYYNVHSKVKDEHSN